MLSCRCQNKHSITLPPLMSRPLCLVSLSLSPNRKQGSTAPAPASPGTKSEKRCIPSCLRHKRCIKRAGWPTSPGPWPPGLDPLTLTPYPIYHPVTTLTVTRGILIWSPCDGTVHSDYSTLDSSTCDWGCWRKMFAWLVVRQKRMMWSLL